MEDLASFAKRPLAFSWRFVRRRGLAHAVILTAVALAVICSIFTQYGVKVLVDTLSLPQRSPAAVWHAFALLVALIAADNLLWRLASWVGNSAFANVTGDVRRDLFRHLTGHAPSYFTAWQPGMLTSRVSATSNAMFTVENLLVWNVLPPCMATFWAIALVGTVSWAMAAGLVVVAALVIGAMFLWAAAGKPLHREFASRAAAVDGELTDVVGNMAMVKAFGGILREHHRFDATIGQEVEARQRSLRYLERLRIVHALVTVALTVGLLTWVLFLWQDGHATTGDVILVCTLGLSVLHATRDLAIALVDVTQHTARFAEALETLLVPHQLCDRPGAKTLVQSGNSVTFENVSFAYPDCPRLFDRLDFKIESGQRVGLVGPSGGGKSSMFALIQRFYDIEEGRILLAEEDITEVTQQSLREAIAVVPQDISLFHRSLMENIRYARPEASDAQVWEAAAAARCDFIAELPQGLDTIVGDRGTRLSGGQRQRVALARAFLKDAPLLLLDEPTSALDSETEADIREALERLMRGRTVIAITHRLPTVEQFDRIIVMQSGVLVQDGAPAELATRPGPYRDLLLAGERRRRADTLHAA
ncbi:MAG TPA: ABC transporter ATP-binding protein [Hyphomicrobiaceae bacterium]|jgi:ATP-binding cassette subfamily B protein|nr:ABC transporter ATP-binding protein [Hyphomicrobiaceae bacterium]